MLALCMDVTGRGFFTGAVTSLEDLPEGDFRRFSLRFMQLDANRK